MTTIRMLRHVPFATFCGHDPSTQSDFTVVRPLQAGEVFRVLSFREGVLGLKGLGFVRLPRESFLFVRKKRGLATPGR